MALSSSHTPSILTTTQTFSPSLPTFLSLHQPHFLQTKPITTHKLSSSAPPEKWRARVSFFPAFLSKRKDAKTLKEELLEAIAPLDRGADATFEDQERVDQVGLYML